MNAVGGGVGNDLSELSGSLGIDAVDAAESNVQARTHLPTDLPVHGLRAVFVELAGGDQEDVDVEVLPLTDLELTDAGAFLSQGITIDFLLAGTSLVTALPLLLFTFGTRRSRLMTVGFMQYIAPSCTFILAVVVYREPFSHQKLVTFILIWAALIIYTYDSLSAYRKKRSAVPGPGTAG